MDTSIGCASTNTMNRPMSLKPTTVKSVTWTVKSRNCTKTWDRDTLIIVTSDHGEAFGEHQSRGHASTLFAEVLNVPLVFHGAPQWRAGKVIVERVSTMDLLPTVTDLTGLSLNPDYEGVSLAPLFRDEPLPSTNRILYAHLHKRQRHESGAEREMLIGRLYREIGNISSMKRDIKCSLT